jgi:LPS-assembly lipoprotein
MSSLDHRPAKRRKRKIIASAVLAGLSALLLTGCIQPMYGPLSEGGGAVNADMQAIAVDPINGRLGHYLGDELIFALNGTGSQVTPKYHLIVVVRETSSTPLIDTVTGYPTSSTVQVAADYRLIPVGATEPVTKGTANVAASYDRTSNRYSDVRAARDAEIRDARSLAEVIRTRIAASLATKT